MQQIKWWMWMQFSRHLCLRQNYCIVHRVLDFRITPILKTRNWFENLAYEPKNNLIKLWQYSRKISNCSPHFWLPFQNYCIVHHILDFSWFNKCWKQEINFKNMFHTNSVFHRLFKGLKKIAIRIVLFASFLFILSHHFWKQ